MTNNIDPFFGEVLYYKRTDLDSFEDPLTSIDGMMVDIQQDCQEIMRLKHSQVPDRLLQMEVLIRGIVRLFQAICYLRLHNSIYINTQDRLWFGIITPLDEDDLDNYEESSSDMWEQIMRDVIHIAGAPGTNIDAMDLLGWNVSYIQELCNMYQGYLTLRRHRR